MRRKNHWVKATKISLYSRFTKRNDKKVVFLSVNEVSVVHFWHNLAFSHRKTLLVSLKEAKRRRRRTKRCYSERSRSRLSAGGGGGALKRRVDVVGVVKRH